MTFSDDPILIEPCLIKAVATGTTYSSLESVVLRPSFSVLLAEDSCPLVIYLTLIALKATESIAAADSFERECSSFSPVEE